MIETTYSDIPPATDSPPPRARRRKPTVSIHSSRTAAVFAVASGKGGVGKTSVVANLATALARQQHRVMAIDADLGLANLDLYLGVRPSHTLEDFFSGAVSLDEIIVTNCDGILLIPGASGVPEITALRPEQKTALLGELDRLTHEMDLVLVDTGSGISDTVTYFTSGAQEIIMVVTPEPSSMTDAYALIKLLALRHRRQRFLLLANNVSGAAEARNLFDTLSRTAQRFLNASLDMLGWIPRDAELMRAAARARTVVRENPDAPSARAFGAVAQSLIERCDRKLAVKGNIQFFLRRMLAARKAAQ